MEFFHVQNLAAFFVHETLYLQQVSDDGLTATKSPNVFLFALDIGGLDNLQFFLQLLLERNCIHDRFFYDLLRGCFCILGKAFGPFGIGQFRE